MISADCARDLTNKAIEAIPEKWYNTYMNTIYSKIKEAIENCNYSCRANLKLGSYYYKDQQQMALDNVVKELQRLGFKVRTERNERHILLGRVLNYDVYVDWADEAENGGN